MNIVNKLTIRHLMLNKKRTLVTIIGAIISVAMITAVSTIGVSFLDLLQRQTIANDGEWHVLYKNVNLEQLQAIKEDEETKTLLLNRDLGISPLKGSQNKNKPYLYIKELNKAGFENKPINLIDGRLPANNNEIVISHSIISNAKVNFNIGDEVTLHIGQRYLLDGTSDFIEINNPLQRDKDGINEGLSTELTKIYKIIGIIETPTWEYAWAPGYTVLTYIDESIVESNETLDAYVIQNKVNSSLFEHAEKIAANNDIKEVSYNKDLLRYYGVIKNDSTREMLFNLSAIIMVIIMVGSISLIYNAFAISVSERSRHLGMLSSVGATKKQKRNSVFFEGIIIGAISIPLGIIAGYIGIGLTFIVINPMIAGALNVTESFRVVVLPSTIIISIIISITTILISTFIPAKRASNISAIDAIRQTSDIKLSNKEVKTSKLTRMLFGIEGDLGLKNLKRNKKRYMATVFSLIISIVLYLSVSYFTSGLEKSLELSQDGVNFDLQVYVNMEDKEEQDNIINQIRMLDDVKESTSKNTVVLMSWVDKDKISDYLMQFYEYEQKDGRYPYTVDVVSLDDESLKEYSKKVGVDFEILKQTDKPQAIVIDTMRYEDGKAGKYIEAQTIKASIGDKLDLKHIDYQTEDEIPVDTIEIVSLTDKLPLGMNNTDNIGGINVIVSKDVFEKIVTNNKDIEYGISSEMYINSDNPMRLEEDINKIHDNYDIYIYNVHQVRQREQQMILLMSVFIYGFITLITAICVANILNTITTSIALRKREFAMLKSIGMTPKSFSKMINYESIFYGLKALLYGLPISIGLMYLMFRTFNIKFSYEFTLPWLNIIITIVAVFVVVGVTMLYSSSKIKKENIIDALKQEII
ncbi:ABC transporter permease [Tissierella sp. Yu-01]|uniref:ABC transporter permease n=1 Tax=Tissierella sp. Yu-01 TaxID=3035694 RepID=UPI00240D5E1C|nr:ABC transporter permease [Tissierella sp. Yu-01]WFA08886.1 FtsX-like permease family protein [Tissierella sp. Yu-01]